MKTITTKKKKHALDAAKAKRNAFILLAVMLVLAAITLSALAFSQSMLIGHEESRLAGETIQARYAADSGIDAARLFLAYPRQTRDESGGTYNNANTFQAINVLTGRGLNNLCNYSLVAPDLNENGKYASFRFGLHNESARLNLNVLPIIDSMMSIGQLAQQMTGGVDLSSLGLSAGGAGAGASGAASLSGAAGALGGAGAGGTSGGAGRTLLMALPGMTEDIADAILDFIDADDEPREYGAEREYYTQLPVPYAPANGPLQSIEQLLLVRDVTPSLLFGLDQNRNGVLEASEKTAAQQSGSSMGDSASTTSSALTDDGAAQLPDLGWAIYLTLYSKEKNVAGDGAARININGSDLATLQTDLATAVGEDLATFIIAYRVNGAGAGGNGGGGVNSGGAGGGGAGGGGVGGGGFGGGGGRNGGGGGPGGAGGGQGGGRGGPGGGGPGGAGGGQSGGRGGPGGGGPGGAGGGQGGGRGGPIGGGPGVVGGQGGGPGVGGGQGGGRGGPGGGGPGGNGGPGGTGGGGRGGTGGGGAGGGRGGRSNFDLSIIDFQPFSMITLLQSPIGGGRGGGGQGGGGAGGGFGGGGRGGNNGGPGGPAGGAGGAGGRGGNNGGPGGPGGGAGGRGGNNGGPGGPGGRDGQGGGRDGQGGGRDGQGGVRDGQGGGRDGQGGGRDGRGGGRDGQGGGRGGPGGGMGGGGTGGGGTGGSSGGTGGTAPKITPWTAAAFSTLNIDTTQGASGKVKQVLDLVDAQFTADVNGTQVTFTSPLTSSPISLGLSLPTIMDKLTAVEATVLPGRININEAPREILSGLPGMTADILDKLIEARAQSTDSQNRKFETWPLVEGIVTLQQMQMIAPLVTGGGDVFRVQSVGYFEQTAGYARTEAVIDASGQIPIVALYRKMDHLGRGFSQASLGQRAMGLAVSQ